MVIAKSRILGTHTCVQRNSSLHSENKQLLQSGLGFILTMHDITGKALSPLGSETTWLSCISGALLVDTTCLSPQHLSYLFTSVSQHVLPCHFPSFVSKCWHQYGSLPVPKDAWLQMPLQVGGDRGLLLQGTSGGLISVKRHHNKLSWKILLAVTCVYRIRKTPQNTTKQKGTLQACRGSWLLDRKGPREAEMGKKADWLF